MSTKNAPRPAPRWVGWWFRGAGAYGAGAILFSVASALARPEAGGLFFQAFAGTAFAFQIAFWIIGGDPVRYRPLMLAGVVEKLGFVVPALLAHAGGQVALAAAVDAALGVGFLFAWFATPKD